MLCRLSLYSHTTSIPDLLFTAHEFGARRPFLTEQRNWRNWFTEEAGGEALSNAYPSMFSSGRATAVESSHGRQTILLPRHHSSDHPLLTSAVPDAVFFFTIEQTHFSGFPDGPHSFPLSQLLRHGVMWNRSHHICRVKSVASVASWRTTTIMTL